MQEIQSYLGLQNVGIWAQSCQTTDLMGLEKAPLQTGTLPVTSFYRENWPRCKGVKPKSLKHAQLEGSCSL